MILDLICSIGLAYFIMREATNVKVAWEAGHGIIWASIGCGLVALLLLTLLAVWL